MPFDGVMYDPTQDRTRLLGQLERVRQLMTDGEWRTLEEIASACGAPPQSISARLRDLRKAKFGSAEVESRRRGDPARGLFEYRVTTGNPMTESTIQACDLLVFDARHLLWRCSDAHKELFILTPDGEQGTGGLYGFLNTAVRIHKKYGGRVVVAWEGHKEANWRKRLFPDYKKRAEPSEQKALFLKDMRAQETMLRGFLSILGVKQFEGEDCEADDVMGMLSVKAGGAGLNVRIYSGDSDLRQLVTDRVHVISATKEGDTFWTPATVKERMGVLPSQIPDLLAFEGDTSDNIPGVDGIGEKSALKLVQTFGSCVHATAAAINKADGFPLTERLREKIVAAGMDHVRLCLTLATIRTDMRARAVRGTKDMPAVIKELRRLQFKSLMGAQEITALATLGGGENA